MHCDLGLGDVTLGHGHDTPLGHGQQLCEILSRSNMAVKSYGPDTHILLCVHFDLDLRGMTLTKFGAKPLGHGQQLWEILSRSNIAVRSYGPDTEFGYVCTVTLTLEIWPWVKVITHPWVMDNNCVKYYPHRTCKGLRRWPGHDVNRRTDRQGDSSIYGDHSGHLPLR